ncbi:MAG TPA: ATP-binding protein [Bacteroidales bacterium]|nr:ATP-binding protein [Bacteroidales bacterium]
MPEDDKNTILQLQTRIRDLEEKLASAAFDNTAQRLKQAELVTGTGNWELHLSTGKMYGSEGAMKIYGLKSCELNYDEVKTIPLPEYRQLMDKAVKDLIDEDQPYNIEFKIRNRENGKILDLHSTAYFDRTKNMIFGVIRDITEQKSNEAELTKRSDNLAIQLKISMDLLEKADRKSVLINILEGTNRLVGLDTAAVYSIDGELLMLESTIPPLPDNFPDEFRKALLKNHPHIAKALNSKQPLIIRDIFESELTAEEKTIIEAKGMKSLLFIPLKASGQNYGIIILGSTGHIHEFSNTEIAICRTISNIASLALENSILISNLRTARDKAEESDRLKTAFLHNISHEIRTPLNAIIGFSGFLEQSDLNESERRKYIDIINLSNTQLLNIINDIFNLSHIEAGQMAIREDKTDIMSVLNNLYNQYLPVTEQKGLLLKLDIQSNKDNICNIRTDEGKLIQVISNLLNNAIKFTDTGSIILGCQLTDRKIKFYIEDTGIGIPQKDIKRIFERFFQVEKPKSDTYSGAGLGLSISDAYVKMMGGELKVESSPGQGSKFWFEIPYKPADTVQTEQVPESSPVEVTSPKTILVAEDESSNARLLELYLKKLNAKVVLVSNGREAVEYCTNEIVDLVLMDIKMPVLDGYSATEQIKKIRPGMNIIAQTAYATAADKLKAMNSGCCDFIPKPINKAELLSTVQKYLNG